MQADSSFLGMTAVLLTGALHLSLSPCLPHSLTGWQTERMISARGHGNKSGWQKWLQRLGEKLKARPAQTALIVPMAARPLPAPALRWVCAGRIALRSLDWNADADAVCAFQAETYEYNFPGFSFSPDFAQAFRFDLRRASLDPQHGLFVLDEGRGVCGFLWLVVCHNTWTGERYGYINNVYIAPHRRKHGLGRDLMAHTDAWFRERGVGRVRLTVSSHNQSAVALYERSGYGIARWEMEKEI